MTIATLRVKDVKDKVRDTLETGQATFTETLRDQADDATMQAKSLTNKVLTKVRVPVTGRIRQLSGTVRNRPMPAAAVIAFGLFLVLRLLLRRNM